MELIDTFEKEAAELENGLYLMPEQAGQIPLLFRKAEEEAAAERGAPARKRGAGDINQDGFEVLEPVPKVAAFERPDRDAPGCDSSEYDSDEEDAFFAALNKRGPRL